MKKWRTRTADPNFAPLIRARQDALARARYSCLLEDRVDYFCEKAKGKRTLDIGIVDHQIEFSNSPNWLHGRICRVAAECHGVDVLAEELTELQRRGFSVSCINLVEAPLSRLFDIIICGDVLEHVDQPGKLLLHCRDMLATDGRVLVSLPNPWYLNVILKALFGRDAFQDNADHVAWFDPSTLYELADRSGLELCRYAGVKVKPELAQSLTARAFFRLTRFSHFGMRREVFAKTMIYEFRAKSE